MNVEYLPTFIKAHYIAAKSIAISHEFQFGPNLIGQSGRTVLAQPEAYVMIR
jgi:hypothetical protein